MIRPLLTRYRLWRREREQRRREAEWRAALAFQQYMRKQMEQIAGTNSVARGEQESKRGER